MNGKDEKREKCLNAESAGEAKFPVVTTWAMLVSGVLLAVLLGFVPEKLWLEADSPIKGATGPLLALVSASMALATVLLTTNYFDNWHKVLASVITGLVAWFAVFSPFLRPPDPDPISALFTLLAMTPLLIAFIGPRMSRSPVKGVPLYLLIGGVVIVSLSLVLETTRAGLVLALLGITAPESVNALLAVSGMVLVLFAALWLSAKSRG